MPVKKIVLAIHSKLLREMLIRVFGKARNLVVVQEITDPGLLPDAIEHSDIDIVIMSSKTDQGEPNWFDGFITIHPSVCIVNIAIDGSQVTFNWLNKPKDAVRDLSLEEFITILETRGG